jgi:hypothetical protein
MDLEMIEGRYAELDDQTVGFETYKHDLDAAPYFRGLPGDVCPCEHHGYVTAGQITFRWPHHAGSHGAREETYVEGDSYVAGPGHTPVFTAGSAVVEFTRTADLVPVMEVVGRNVEAILGSSS